MVYALILAGGGEKDREIGGIPRQFATVHGKPVMIHTLEKFQEHDQIDGIVISCAADWIEWVKNTVKKYGIDKVIKVVPGGKTGHDSIHLGLDSMKTFAEIMDVVLINEAVRPFVTYDLISRNIEAVLEYDNAITCEKIKEPIIICNDENNISDVLGRKNKYVAKAPQSFYYGDVYSLYNRAAKDRKKSVDTAHLCRIYNIPMHFLKGPQYNMKISTNMDYHIYKTIYDVRKQDFLSQNDICEDSYSLEYREDVIREELYKWFYKPSDQSKYTGLVEIGKKYKKDFPQLIGYLSESFYDKRVELEKVLSEAEELKYVPRKTRTVGLFYFRMANGGTECVVAQLCSMFLSAGYKVVLVTEEKPSEEDYLIPDDVVRELIPGRWNSNHKNYLARMYAWHKILDKYHIDILFDSMWWEPAITFWDMLAIKSHQSHPAFVIHCHNCAGYTLLEEWAGEVRRTYGLADALVALSRYDKKFWQITNRRTYMIHNPCYVPANGPKPVFSKKIVWVGRIHDQKQPLEIVRIMKLVAAKVPEAVCHVVGGDSPKLFARLQQEIKNQGLEKNVILEGFHKDVSGFYEEAAVLLQTSKFEGYPLVLVEGAAHGLPLVAYELPWLEFYHVFQGWTVVPQLDAEAAAEALINLITNEDVWQEKSRQTYQSFEKYKEIDIFGAWEKLMNDIESGIVPNADFDEDMKMIVDQLVMYHCAAMKGV